MFRASKDLNPGGRATAKAVEKGKAFRPMDGKMANVAITDWVKGKLIGEEEVKEIRRNWVIE